MSKINKFAIILCTLNEEKSIIERIINLRATIVPPHSVMDIYIFDNHSTDQTKELIKNCPEFNKTVFLFETGRTGKCNSIFTAMSMLIESYDYFILTDANTITKIDFLENLYKKSLEDNNYQLFVCNMRHVKNDQDGMKYFNSDKNKLSFRHRIEEKIGKSSGANGGLYMVRTISMRGIYNFECAMNDDFIISCYAQRSGRTAWCATAKAFEIEYNDNNVFRAKFRDARGHLQALRWLFSNIESKWTYYFAGMRLVYWFSPLIIFLLTISILPIHTFFFIPLFCINRRIRIFIIKLLALYCGILSSGILSAPSQWTPLR